MNQQQSSSNTTDLKDRVVLVTGGSRGIGRAIAALAASRGAKVMITARKQLVLDDAARAIEGEVEAFAANAGEPDQAEACVTACIERFGKLDVLVNNAATTPYWGGVIDQDLASYDKTWRVNLRGALAWTQQAWHTGMRDRGGVVLNISSLGGRVVVPNAATYNTTKAALEHLTAHLALELSPRVRVCGIAPGLVRTEMSMGIIASREEEYRQVIPVGRLGEPDDVAQLACFLMSDAASWITGQTFVIDGGISITGPKALL